MYELSDEEQDLLKRVSSPYYMSPIIKLLIAKVDAEDERKSPTKRCERWKQAFNLLHEVLVEAKGKVDALLETRLREGKIKNVDQARKSIAGNAFSNLLIFTFLKNKECGNVGKGIFINNRASEIKGFRNISVVRVGNETQKPDVDVVIYTKRPSGEVDKSIILSLKTSLRERAGQTYKWKLLLEIATTDNPIRQKYDIAYDIENPPYVCFATVNFYEEIDQPQHRGMFKFFDGAFIAKPIERDFIRPLSELVNFVNEKLG